MKFHWHNFIAIYSATLKQTDFQTNITQDKTGILYKCDCGKYKTELILGHWSNEQLRIKEG